MAAIGETIPRPHRLQRLRARLRRLSAHGVLALALMVATDAASGPFSQAGPHARRGGPDWGPSAPWERAHDRLSWERPRSQEPR
jgi:hypothetical protein